MWSVGDAVYGEVAMVIVIPVWAHVWIRPIHICRMFSRQMTSGLRLTGSKTAVLFKVK